RSRSMLHFAKRRVEKPISASRLIAEPRPHVCELPLSQPGPSSSVLKCQGFCSGDDDRTGHGSGRWPLRRLLFDERSLSTASFFEDRRLE
ncbi:hypothetical protein C7999DRAFT_11935, partial [Corynascus novoguineensis]